MSLYARRSDCAKAAYSWGAGKWVACAGTPRPRARDSLGAQISRSLFFFFFFETAIHSLGAAACLARGSETLWRNWLRVSSGSCWRGVTRVAGPVPVSSGLGTRDAGPKIDPSSLTAGPPGRPARFPGSGAWALPRELRGGSFRGGRRRDQRWIWAPWLGR